ncbi:MAG: DUF1080 domain-containing protein [Planctomycetia bacterium]|nr:DUF1080 domain-containing protein [Planctomycetia bacterium]
MKHVIWTLAILGAVCFTAVELQAQTKAPEGFTPLFNAKNLDGWIGIQRDLSPYKLEKFTPAERKEKQKAWDTEFAQHWYVENGELVNDGKGPYATTVKSYKDFELLIEYKTVAKADSGIYLRMTPQVQIWDTTKEGGKWDRNANKGSGGLFNNKKTSRDALAYADKPFGQWNSFRITIVGDVVNVWLNGIQTVKDQPLENYWNRDLPLIPSAPIQLQTHGGEIRWRNIFIKEL